MNQATERRSPTRLDDASFGTSTVSCHPSPVTRHPRSAFTLIELLVVISIMGLIAALAVPALKNLGQSNIQTSATRQLLDDIGRARQLAISQHTTVYMVFVSPNFITPAYLATLTTAIPSPTDQQTALTTLSNLVNLQYTGYNFVSYGKVGDQPGQHSWQYLSTWQALPDGNYIAPAKFLPPGSGTAFPISAWQTDYPGKIDNWQYQIIGFANFSIPFPTAQSPSVLMPYIAFDYTGKLISEFDGVNYHHAYIPLAQGSVMWAHDANKLPVVAPVQLTDITENPPGNSSGIAYNVIDVDPLSGRARLMVHPMP